MPDLPHGNVTFLFTDLEGSTRLWRRYAEAMPDAYARHDLLLHRAVEAHRGVIYKVVGDGCQAAFASAGDALDAALEAQRELVAEEWQTPEPLRSRMALHTGAAEPQPNGDYRTAILNVPGRLLGAGYGGQVLLSAATAELVRDLLPSGVALRDLGERRLRDLPPARIYQLLAPGLPATFPPLNTIDARSHNLPEPPTPLVGREREVAAATAQLRSGSVRLLTLTGPGGTGKTRLALAIAADLIDDFDHGVTFVALAPVTDPALVASTIARELGVQEEAGRDLADLLIAHLREKRLLLVLDNFEQVAPAASLIAQLLAACPGLTVLATSRMRLHLRAERGFPVPPLALPDLAAPIDTLMQAEAARFFVDRARAISPDFIVNVAVARSIAEVCHRLDGLPLAIELAAAWVTDLTPGEMLARLETRLPLLTDGAFDLPDRQRTLRSTIDWSYDLLSRDEQTLFRRLAVFAGGWLREAAVAVGNPPDHTGIDVDGGLTSLVDKSLIRIDTDARGDRYTMLETIREYGLDQLLASGEAEAVRRAHATQFLTFATNAAPGTWGSDQADWLDRLDLELDNLRAALTWAIDRAEAQTALDLGISMEKLWDVRGSLDEGRRWLEQALALPMDGVRPAARAQAHSNAGSIAQSQGDLEGARRLQEQALAILVDLDTEGGQRGTAHTLNRLGIVAFLQGDSERADTLHEEALERFRDLDDKSAMATVLNNLGVTADHREEYDRARSLYEEALALQREAGDTQSIAIYLGNLGEVTRDQGDFPQAAAYYREALLLWAELRDRWNLTATLDGVAELAIAYKQPHHAARLLGAGAALRAAAGVPLPENERAAYERSVAAAREALGDGAFDVEWAAGQAMTYDEAIREASAVIRAME
ncbi:MAG TPA: tetratricopeptide repeat protein [Thermomicrobiales bacterium]|nr:tetratricopeptide repeat protein [Thermomicrobiales bacterium]